jgi:hypothetical protein
MLGERNRISMKKQLQGTKATMHEGHPVCPEGYRFLRRGEVIEKPDLFCSILHRWLRTVRPGRRTAGVVFYIRRIKSK